MASSIKCRCGSEILDLTCRGVGCTAHINVCEDPRCPKGGWKHAIAVMQDHASACTFIRDYRVAFASAPQ